MVTAMSKSANMSQFQAHKPAAAAGGARRFEAVVLRLDRYTPDVIGLTLAPADGAPFTYRPGQYLSVILDDGRRRSFSMANDTDRGRLIELHVRRRPGGRFSDEMLTRLKAGDRLLVEGPYGHLDWRENGGTVLLMGAGTGLAPLKALIEHGLAVGGACPIHLYWSGRTPEALYLSPHLHRLAQNHERFKFTPLLSRPHPAWPGRRGYVQDAVAEDFTSLHTAIVYACGSPPMIQAARARLGALPGFHEDHFLTDAFEPAETPPQATTTAALSLCVSHRGEDRRVAAASGSTLLAALQAAGAPVLSVCGGKASCGACKISVSPVWLNRIAPPERTERRLLANLEGVGPCDRLSCQIHLTPEVDGLAVSLAPETTALWPA